MKKYALILLSFFLIANTQAADLRVSEGLAYWNTSAKSKLSTNIPGLGEYSITMNEKSMENADNAFFFVEFEHPVTGVPNFRLAYTLLKHDGKGEWQVGTVCTPCDIKGSLDLSHVDLTPYYKVVNTRYFTMDLGLTARNFHGDIVGEGVSSAANGVKIKSAINSTYGLAYTQFQFLIPKAGVSFGLIANAGKYSDKKATDIDGYFRYRSQRGVGFMLGYRAMDADLVSDAKAGTEKVKLRSTFKVAGPYLAIFAQF